MGILAFLLWLLATLFVGLFLVLVVINVQNTRYFKQRGIPFLNVSFKSFLKFLVKGGMVELEKEVYKNAKPAGPLVGLSDMFISKGYYITDLDLIRNIYVKDFDHFVNRRPVKTQESNTVFKKMLFATEDEQWKGIRNKLSPTFTTGKIRRMFSIFTTSSENMSSFVSRYVGQLGGDFNFADAFPKYAMDVIASCAFGIDSKCFEAPIGKMSMFEEMGKRFQFSLKPLDFLKFVLMLMAPKVADILKLNVFDQVPQTYFDNVIRDVMKRRRQEGERREDFLQLMLDAQQGRLKSDEDTSEVMYGTTEKSVLKDMEAADKNMKVTFDDDDIVANCLLFMLGGFDTTQSLLLFAVYQLALEPEEQEKVFAEISSFMNKTDGKLSYEAVLKMNYLDMFLNETLRLFPPAARTERSCTKDYPISGTNAVIEKGMVIGLPIYGIHHDPDVFENPEKFDPERFLPERKAERHPYSFMPFGHGPRNCIGMRFALTEVKAVIAQLVYNFKFEPCQKTKVPMEFDSNSNLKPKGGMWLHTTPRKK